MNQLKQKAKTLLLPIMIGLGNMVNAQTSECLTDGTVSPYIPVSAMVALPCVPSSSSTTDFNSFYARPENYKPVNWVTDPLYVHKTIKVLFHVMQPSTGGGIKVNYEDNPTDRALLQSIVDKMNDWLSNVPAPSAPMSAVCGSCHVTDSRFRVAMAKKPDGTNDIRFHPDGLAFEHIFASPGAGPASYDGDLNTYFENPEGVLNVFLMFTTNPYGPLGGVSMGDYEYLGKMLSGFNTGLPFIVTENYFRTTSINLVANNLLHEIGHTMATHHTFDGSETCSETNWDYLSDAFGTAATFKKCPLTMYSEDVFMNYNTSGNYLTPLQIARWHRNAHFMSCRKYVYNTYPEDINHDHTGQGQTHPYNITKNETWDFDIKMYNDIVVKSGNKLSIKCRVMMPYHSNIIVEPGAELELDGGIITSHHDTTMWYGISVWGNSAKSQYVTTDQGLFTMKNGATISNALHAVILGDAVYYSSGRGGGIARIENSYFINNRASVDFADYHNYGWEFKGGVWTRTLLQANKSYIAKSSFEVNDQMIRDPYHQISMSGVEGVSILGCSFVNTMPYTPTATRCTSGCAKSDAIITWNANFNLDHYETIPSAPITPSYFKGFRHAVLAQSFSVTNNFTVKNTTFEKNLIGVASNSVNGFKVKNNTFLIDNPISSGVAALGMQLNRSSMYQVYYNTFDKPTIEGSTRIGVEVVQGGSDFNKIKNNTYNNMHIGNQSTFQNTNEFYDVTKPEDFSKGLEFACNTHSNNYRSMYIAGYKDPATLITHDGVRRIQGSAALPAGNSFTGGFWGVEAQNAGSFLYTLPLDKYYYYTGAANQNPLVSVNVFKTSTGTPNPCVVVENSTTGGSTTGGTSGVAAEAARLHLAEAYDDYSENRPTLLNDALVDMQSPYAEIERSLLHMQLGNVAQGLGIYYAISSTMDLTLQEQTDFALGGILMRIIADKYTLSNTPRWDSLSNTELDSIRFVRDNTQMWAHQRACNWLSYANDEPCELMIPEIPKETENNQRQAQENGLSEDLGNYLSIRPNPSANYFDVNYVLNGEQAATIKISDAAGRTIMQSTLPLLQKTYRINASEWASGVYLYHIVQQGKTLYNGKLIKQ
jgi:hypothetical protein